jgi:hypothetical protein
MSPYWWIKISLKLDDSKEVCIGRPGLNESEACLTLFSPCAIARDRMRLITNNRNKSEQKLVRGLGSYYGTERRMHGCQAGITGAGWGHRQSGNHPTIDNPSRANSELLS